MKYNLLVVTDHATHSATNSLYKLSVALHADKRSKNVWVCSKGFEQNRDFFSGHPDATLHVSEVNDSFEFDPSGNLLLNTSIPIDKEQIDAVLIRMPQPLDKTFILSLESIASAGKIINRPQGAVLTSSKEFLVQVAHLCPSPRMCYSLREAIDLSRQVEIVLKPIFSYGGRGIVRLSHQNFWHGMERHKAEDISLFLNDEHFPMLAMKYLPNVSFGDKRTIVVNRQIVGSALRLPAKDSWLCNVAQGGHAIISEANEEELMIERELTPLLYDKGVVMYGFDTLVDDDGLRVLSEINTLSIGGLGPMEELSGKPILKKTAQLLWDYIEANR